MAQSPPIIQAENGSVAVLSCSGIKITSTSVPNPSIVQWRNDYDNNPLTPDDLVQTGGLTYLPTVVGHYYVVFPWHPSSSNLIEAQVFTPLAPTQDPLGNLTNSFTFGTACYPNSSIDILANENPDYDYSFSTWYQNGDIISMDADLFNLWRPGTYTRISEGPCGSETITHQLDYECDNNVLGSSCGYDRTYEFGGTIGVPGGTTSISANSIFGGTITLLGTVDLSSHIKMEQDAIIYVGTGSKLTIDRTVFTSCGTWKGIVIDGGEIVFTSAGNEAWLCDAEIGLTIVNSARPFTIRDALFEDNGVHVAAFNSDFDIDNVEFNSLAPIPNNNPYAGFLAARHTSNPMFYATGSNISLMLDCTFDQRDDNVIGTSVSTTAIELDNTYLGANGYLNILDNFKYGIYATDCDGIYIKATHFGSEYVSTYTPYIPNPPFSQNGIYLKNCVNTDLANISLSPHNIGIQFYLNEDNTPQTIGSNFRNISIGTNGGPKPITGIIIAPDENPLTNTDPAINTSTTPIKLGIECSRIANCTYGIVGGGRKTDWESMDPVTGTIPKYDPSIEFSSNSDWNIVWSERIDWSLLPAMKYYTTAPYSNPLAVKLSTLLLDGMSIPLNNTLPNGPFDAMGASGVHCTPSWISYKRDPLDVDEQALEEHTVLAYPNPFHSQISFSLEGLIIDRIIIRDILGSKVFEVNAPSDKMTIDTKSWRAGLYFMTTVTDNSTQTIKIIKH